MIFKIFWGHILWCNYYLNYIYYIKYIIYMILFLEIWIYILYVRVEIMKIKIYRNWGYNI